MRALVLCDDTWHPAETIRRGLQPLAGIGFEFDFAEDGAAWNATQMSRYPLTVLAKANITSSAMENPWLTAGTQAGFFEYVRGGGGLVAIHAGTCRYEKLNVMNDLIGGAFVQHPDQCEVRIEPKNKHPMTEGMAPFAVKDEHYFIQMDAKDADVFLHSRSEHGVQPAGWSRTEGIGRVCALTPGHNLEVWLHPEFQKLLTNALRWAAKMN